MPGRRRYHLRRDTRGGQEQSSTLVFVHGTRPGLIHSWGSDSVGALDRHYVWHDRAHLWQTPGAGEVAVDSLLQSSFDDKVT
jgi:hypothetical protein